jgi:transposase
MLSDSQKSKIFELKSRNWTWKNIASAVSSKAETCRGYFKSHKAKSALPPKIKVSKALIQGSVALKIKRMVRDSPSISYRDIENELKKGAAENEHVPRWTTIRSFLVNSGYKMMKLIKKPMLSEINRKKRIDFARKYLENPPEFWNHVIWSDETVVRSNPNSKEIFVKVHSSVKRKNLPFNTKSQNQGVGVMFWGCFSYHGLSKLVVVDETMNAEKYKNVLEHHLVPELRNFNSEIVFMQDNAPCHKARTVLQFFVDHGITVMDWPAQSPDLNPIENLWSIIKQRRAKKFGMPTTKNELIQQIFQIWENIDAEIKKKLAESVPKRLKELIENNGKQLNY